MRGDIYLLVEFTILVEKCNKAFTRIDTYMQDEKRIVGTTTITAGYRISLIRDVRKILETKCKRKIKEGDKIVYFQLKNGDIVISIA
jgi:aminoglycoside N3'-acetyltransferase